MDLAELSRKSYLNEDWYSEQTPQWDKMSDDGWVFHRPAFIPGTVGIAMRKGRDSAVFRTSSELSREDINTRLLCFCEMFSKASL